jgi:membrane-associated phospholipid phosphatase
MHYPSDVLAGAVLGYGLGRAYPLPPEPPEPPASADGDGPAIEEYS